MEADRRLTFQGFCPDLATDQLLSGDEVVALTPKALTVLRRLVEDGGQRTNTAAMARRCGASCSGTSLAGRSQPVIATARARISHPRSVVG